MTKIKPTKKQLDFMEWEMGVFFHFGIRTFYEGYKDWDGKEMKLSSFNPTELDCEQWIKTVCDAGGKYAVLTTKHHDGFALWPSEYTQYSVKNTPWKNGNGDVVREYVEACRKYNIKVGLYYSPAQFGYTEMKDSEYDDYFINQISELLINYGKIDYLWFDGCGSENHEYDTERIISVIRGLQPDILIFSMWDPDTRWVGNEEGVAPPDVRYTVSEASTSINDSTGDNYVEEKFLPYECDCRIRRFNWFYSENDEHLVRSVEDLMGLYDYSVGRGGNLLLNIAPDRRGLLPEKDVNNFIEFGKAVKKQFEKPIDIEVIRENDMIEIKTKHPSNIKTIVIEEDLTDGEGVKEFDIRLAHEPWDGVSIYKGHSIGHRRIIRIPSTFIGVHYSLKIFVTDYNESYNITSVKLFED